jgi:hypothetical protein
MSIEVDTAARTVRLDASGTYTAEQLLDLLKALSAARAQIAKDPARPGDIWVAPRASVHTQLMDQAGPETLLALSFPGLGWIGATMTGSVRAQLLSLLAAQQAAVLQAAAPAAPPAEPTPTVESGSGGGHTLH